MPWGILVILPFAIVITWSLNINNSPECLEWEEITVTEQDCWTDNNVHTCGPVPTKALKCKEWIAEE